MSVQPLSWPEPAPEVAAAVRAAYRRREPPLPVTVRDRLGELFPDAEFAPAFGVRGRPGWSPGRLALVTVLQMAENLTDRQAADAVRDKISWKYALGLDLDDEGFDPSVLSRVPHPGGRARSGAAGAGSAAGRAEGRGAGRRGRQAAHRLHPRDRRGARSEPAGAGRGERARRPGGDRGGRAGVAAHRDRHRRLGAPLRGPGRHLAVADLEDQAGRADGGLRPRRGGAAARGLPHRRHRGPALACRATRGGGVAPGAGAELCDHHQRRRAGGGPGAGGRHRRSPARQNPAVLAL